MPERIPLARLLSPGDEPVHLEPLVEEREEKPAGAARGLKVLEKAHVRLPLLLLRHPAVVQPLGLEVGDTAAGRNAEFSDQERQTFRVRLEIREVACVIARAVLVPVVRVAGIQIHEIRIVGIHVVVGEIPERLRQGPGPLQETDLGRIHRVGILVVLRGLPAALRLGGMAHGIERGPVHERNGVRHPVPLRLVRGGEIQLAPQPALHRGPPIHREVGALELGHRRVRFLGDANRVGLPLASQEPAGEIRRHVGRVASRRVAGPGCQDRLAVDRIHRRADLGLELLPEPGIPEIILRRKLRPDLLEEPDRRAGVCQVLFAKRLVEGGRMERVDANRVRVNLAREGEPAAVVRAGDGELTGEMAGGSRAQVDAADEHGTRGAVHDDLEPVPAGAHVPGRIFRPGQGRDEEHGKQNRDYVASSRDWITLPSSQSPPGAG